MFVDLRITSTNMILGDKRFYFESWEFYPTSSINNFRSEEILGDAKIILLPLKKAIIVNGHLLSL